MSPDDSDNIKKSLAFLRALYGEERVNIVAIDPHSEYVTGRTRSLNDPELKSFLEKNYDKRNLYYSVNGPHSGATDGKLKKEHIGTIYAVWIDADPKPCPEGVDFKGHFKAERKRLKEFAKELMADENPPTVIVDSGGGFQAFWFLETPVPGIPGTIAYYEGINRALAQKYGTDNVHNIDRIMRLPYTWNIPTKKKKSRSKALAKSTRIGKFYKHIDWIEPIMAAESENDKIDYAALDWNYVRSPISDDLTARLDDVRERNRKIDDLFNGKMNNIKPTRSERDFTLAKELKSAGFDLNDTGAVMWNFPHGKGDELTKREIVRCYERSGIDFAEGLPQEDIDRISAQVNPLKTAKEKAKKLVSRNSGLITGDKVDYKQNSIPLVKGLIDRNTTNLFFGPSTGGKSFLMIDMGVSLAKGYKFWDQYRIPEKCGVLIVLGEGGGGYHKRVEVAMRKHKITDRSPQSFPFAFISGTFNMFNDDEFSRQSRQKIIDAVKELEKLSGHKVRLIVYDTMSKMLGSGNENEAKDVRVFQGNAEKIAAECNLASLIVHHTGKEEGAGARGSYALLGDMEAQLQLTIKKIGNVRTHYLSSPKQKDHADDKVTTFKLNVMELGKDDDGDPIDSCFVVLKNDQNAALFPSVEDELDFNAICALKAIRFYHSIPGVENLEFRHTEKQNKAILFNDFKENNSVFDENDATNALSQLDMMAKPDKTVLKAFERCCDTLATKGLTRKNAKYQPFNQDCDICDKDTT